MAKLKYGFSSLVSILRFTGTRYYSGGAAGDLLPSLTVNREGNIDAGEFVKVTIKPNRKTLNPLLYSRNFRGMGSNMTTLASRLQSRPYKLTQIALDLYQRASLQSDHSVIN